MIGIGVFIGYVYTNTMNKGFYIESYITSVNVDILRIFLYHLTYFIIFIPILLRLIYLSYLLIMVSLTEKYVAEKPEGEHYEEENNKMVTFKDIDSVPVLHKLDTLVTTIDTFLNRNVKLKSIKVKDIFHNF